MIASDDAISAISRGHIAELKGLANPPEPVKQVMSALLLLLDANSLEWASAKKLLASPSFK